MEANHKNQLPQEGTCCSAVGESLTEQSSVSPSYSGGDNDRPKSQSDFYPSFGDALSQGGSPTGAEESLGFIPSTSTAPKEKAQRVPKARAQFVRPATPVAVEEGSDAGSESDAASGAKGSFKSPELVEVGAAKFLKKKRSKPGDGQGSSSDGGLNSGRRKIGRRGGVQGRGGGRGLTTQEPSRASPAEPAQGAERLPMEGPSDTSGGELDAAAGSKAERVASSFEQVVVAAIKGVALKRIQASKDKVVPAATASIMAAARALQAGLTSDEMSEMRAEVGRLTAAMELLRKENEVLRADLARLRGAGPQQEVRQGVEQQGQGLPVPAEDRVLTLVRQELAAFHNRFSVLEGIVLRPPLAASKPATFAATVAATARPTAKPAANPAAKPAAAKLVPPPPKAKKGGTAAQAAVQRARPPALAAGRLPPPPPPPSNSSPADTEWQVAGENRRAGKAKRAANRKERRQRRKKRSAAARLRAPKSAAVVITLQPEAEKKGVTYREVLAKAWAAVNLEEIGVADGFRMKVTATGARMLEIPGAASGPTADALAERLRASLNAEEARVSRPTKCADMRILGLDDCVTAEEVVAAVARTGGCSAEQVRAGTIRPDNTGMQTVTVSCPVSAAQKIAGEGRRLRVGWVSAQVKLLEPRPLRCFRCRVGNHVGACCTSEVDRSDHCFRCGQPGHKAGSCNATPHCFACAAAGKPADHRAGGKACAPPPKPRGRGKPSATAVTAAAATIAAAVAATTAVAAAANTAAGPSQGAQEGAEMECQ